MKEETLVINRLHAPRTQEATFKDLGEALQVAATLARRHGKRASITISYVETVIKVEVKAR